MADTEIEYLRDLLRNDATMQALATGSWYMDYASGDGDVEFPISVGITPGAYEEVGGKDVLRPCGVLSLGASVEPPDRACDLRQFLRVGFYQVYGYDVIQQMRRRVRALFDADGHGEQHGPLSDERYFVTRFTGSLVHNTVDPSIESARILGEGVSHAADQYAIETDWS